MANFKRKGPKSTRAGCLMCKPHKRQGTKLRDRVTFRVWQKMRVLDEQMAEFRRNGNSPANA
ncbi:hypothetical protein ACFPT7_19150 [Acidicapsa dinghuensis]|uniref:30S ribosomal protein S14 n=1 Tax=Acidicapsa dinghuensis TaxID=2218256 RepID=A0ABW1EMB6_9BACT|nr:hypothetical protein [Acidicapsa dinghuensis]